MENQEDAPQETANYSRPIGARVTYHDPNQTYARYEQAPFRKFSERKVNDIAGLAPLLNKNQRRPLEKKPSRSSLLKRMLSRQNHLEETVKTAVGAQQYHGLQAGHETANYDYSTGQDDRSDGRPKPAYSLAGPRGPPPTDQYKSYRDPDYRDFSTEQNDRPHPQWGLAKPFPHVSRRGKKSRRGRSSKEVRFQERTQGQSGGGPSTEEQDGKAQGSGPAGGPAGKGKNPEDEDEAGHSNWVEHFADPLTGPPGELGRNDSDETLTEKGSDGKDDDEEAEEEEKPNWWFPVRRMIREPLAEWLGTMVAVLIGTCGNLQMKTSDGENGSFGTSAACWGFGTMMAIYLAGGVSGAHCNPMVSISLSVFRGFPFRKCVIYIAAQIVGAICAVLIAYGIYHDAIISVDPTLSSGSKGTGKAFFTLPASFATAPTAFFTDFVSAAVMLGTVLAMGDDSNAPPGAGMHAFIIGLVGFVMASTLGYNTGPQTNPAKDLATRLVPYWVGYGSDMWVQGWWAEAWAAAVFGGLTGCLIYDICIFEGPESPVNYPRIKNKHARQGTKAQWLTTGIMGRSKKRKAKKDLEEGRVGMLEKQERQDRRKLDGH